MYGQGLFNGTTIISPIPNTNLEGSVTFISAVAVGTVILIGNEVHVGSNYTPTFTTWGKNDLSRLSGQGYNIEIRRIFLEKNRFLLGFQRNDNDLFLVLMPSKPLKVREDEYYFGYMRDIAKNKTKCQPYIGGALVQADSFRVALFMGARFPITPCIQVDGRMALINKSINFEMGINWRYRKGRWRDIKL